MSAGERLVGFLRGCSVRRPGDLVNLLKVLAFFVFLAALAGATYGVSAVLGDTASAQAVAVDALAPSLNATPGHAVTFPVKITNRGAASGDYAAEVTGLGDAARSATVTAPANANHTVFVTLDVPSNATPGTYPLAIKVLDAEGRLVRERSEALKLRVLGNGEGFANGDSADVVYTGRISATGNVFSTNDPALAGQKLATTDQFPSTVNTRLLTVATVPRVSVVTGFYEGMLGMQEGEARTVTFGPDKGYGNATVEQTEDRETVLPHTETLPLPSAQLSTEQFGSYLNDTNQGNAADYHEGSIVTNERNGETLRYRITKMDASGVSLVLDVHEGERYTLYPVWANASIVTNVSGENVTFRTEPPVALNETFTYYSYWPNMSRIVSITNESIVIRHSPNVGMQYTTSGSQLQAPQTFTVKELRDDAIVVTTANANQLAGKELTFDIRLVKLHKGAS